MRSLLTLHRLSIKDYLKSNVSDPLMRMLPLLLPYWKTYMLMALCLFLNILITFAMAWFLKSTTDAAINKDLQLLKHLFILGVFLLVFVSLVTYLNQYVESMAICQINRDTKIQLFNKTLRLRADHFLQYHSGELLSRLTNDILSAAGLVGSNLLNLIRLPIMSAAVFAYLASLNWKLALISLSVAPLVLASGLFFGILLKNNNKLMLENLARINSFLNDVFAGYVIVRSFSLERLMSRRYRQHSDRQLSLEAKAAKLSASMQAGAAVVGGVAYFVNLGFGSYLVAAGSLSVGSLLAFISLMHYLVYPFMDFASSWSSFQRSVSAFERVWEILGNPSELNVMPAPFRSSLPSLSVELQDVSFSYDGETMVLKHLNLVIPAGKTVAIVGPSGAGKSTLFKLLLGLYQPSSGNILFDKKCVHQYSVTEFRSFIAYVPQETYLFDGTIRENLLYGYIHATEPELIKAAKDANIHEFIMSLPDQYNAKIGERGIRLSGGQKQRLSIARALLKNAPLLLLDEATSFLDNENELAVQASLAKLMSGRTTIVIAHRLSTIQNADWIIFLDKGTVVAEGTHDMLIKPDTPYSKMYNLEFRQHELSLIK